jgi:hypothetical protein
MGGKLVQVWQRLSDVCGRVVFSHGIAMVTAFFETQEKTLILTPTEDMTEILLWQLGTKFIFGQDHRTLGILMFPSFHSRSQWIEGTRDTSCEQLLSFSSSLLK